MVKKFGINFKNAIDKNDSGVNFYNKFSSISNCDFTVQTFSDLEDVSSGSQDVEIGRRCRINDSGLLYRWTGTYWEQVLG